MLVMGGDDPAHGAWIECMNFLERPRDCQVIVAPPRRAGLEIGDLPDLVVAEIVRVGTALPDQLPAPQLVERSDEAVPGDRARPCEHLHRELTSDCRCGRQDLARWRG